MIRNLCCFRNCIIALLGRELLFLQKKSIEVKNCKSYHIQIQGQNSNLGHYLVHSKQVSDPLYLPESGGSVCLQPYEKRNIYVKFGI
jgi:hypothetical protein